MNSDNATPAGDEPGAHANQCIEPEPDRLVTDDGHHSSPAGARAQLHARINVHALAAVAILTHGPIDIGVTLAFPALETNPVIGWLGVPTWIAVKTVLLTAITVVAYDATRVAAPPKASHTLFLAVWALLGAGVVVTNGAVLLVTHLAGVIPA